MQGARILLVEDDAAIATVIRVAIEAEGAALSVAGTLKARDAMLAEQSFDAVLTDVMLPDGNGLVGLDALVSPARGAPMPVIVLSAQNTLDTAVRAEAAGAFEYLPKPFDLDELVGAVRSALRGRPAIAVDHDHPGEDRAASGAPIIGRDPAMQLVYRTLARVAPTDLSVLILGESGTGKELVARAIHDSGPRAAAPFVAVNMAAIPRELIESELFGHEKGAFTGAHARSRGRFEQANGGTLFLDEIGDMPIEAQTRLLRVLQSGEYSPIGSPQVLRANVRILAATNQDLPALVAAGRFREDLYYRLNVIPISLPPLRERRSDVALLARHFLIAGAQNGLPPKVLTHSAVAALTRHDWPGNVRELSNTMQRLALLTRSHSIDGDDVVKLLDTAPQPLAETPSAGEPVVPPGERLDMAIRDWLKSADAAAATEEERLHSALIERVEQVVIDHALALTGGNQLRAAALLGINRNTLRLKRRQN